MALETEALRLGSLLKWLFDISPRETSFERRGFRGGNAAVRARLEQVGVAFVAGYRAALEDSSHAALIPKLEALEPLAKLSRSAPVPGRRNVARHESLESSNSYGETDVAAPGDGRTPVTLADASVTSDFRGFAYEGAAMALALLDRITPWNRSRVAGFLAGPGEPHTYMVHVGAGWVLARMPGSVDKFLSRFDPLLRWLIVDGYGFHEAFFHFPRYLAGEPIPKRVQGYARRVFDQGFGRCLWFVEGTEVGRIAQTIAGFPLERQGDFWSGIGLSSVYAGEVGAAELRSLREAAGSFAPQLAQGAAFAAKARQRAGNLTLYQDVACGILCGMTSDQAARVTDDALENLPLTGPEPAYEIWRRRIQERLAVSAPRQTTAHTEVHL